MAGKGYRKDKKMSSKLIITIGREFGAEGHEIGKELAERLGFDFYDKDMLALAAKKSGIDINVLASSDESIMGHFLSPYLTIGKLSPSMGDKLFQVQTDIVHDLAAKGGCVIIGRLADYILKDNPYCLKVFVFAPMEKRIEIIKNKHQIDEASAKKLVKTMDSARRNYYTYYSDGKWDRKEGKDILLNRAAFSVAECVDILEAMARAKESSLE